MTDDIVTRLRKIASKYLHDPEDIVPRLRNLDCHGNGLCETAKYIAAGDIEMLRNKIAEAVDEIERLRAVYEQAYWVVRAVLEDAEYSLESPHPLWSHLNELMEICDGMENKLQIPNRTDAFKREAH